MRVPGPAGSLWTTTRNASTPPSPVDDGAAGVETAGSPEGAQVTNTAEPGSVHVSVGAERTRIVLSGDIPSVVSPPSGCRFHTRCFQAQARCRAEVPELRPVPGGQAVRCHFPLGAG